MRLALALLLIFLCVTACQNVVPQLQVITDPAAATETAIANTVAYLLQGTQASAATSAQSIVDNPPTPTPQTTPDPEQDPAYILHVWLEAIFGRDTSTVARYTCAANQEEVGMISGILNLGSNFSLDLGVGSISGIKSGVDLSDTILTIVAQDSTQAVVSSSGQVSITLGGFFRTQKIPYTETTLIREDGRWKVCDF